ncbi:hypothetical protein NQ317_010088 [Molorchus minor]|uniref:26S proteasome non-ATPase regulatory subunit 4 n=1 Tax=Molorchus minor TaxID=1323400 RepID=A0ABQ9JDP3_9CUCU|nr:hypothetical protein NQ317_010088 [Molorchus minor]
MVLESTMICVDNSDFMRNGDFLPTRLQAQQDAVNLVCHSKTRSNPENNVGLLTFGELALKHRQGKNHKMRIVAFVGSPIASEEKELVKLGKKLKKEKVNVDVISFGEDAINSEALTTFINTLNGKVFEEKIDGTGSHLVTVPPGPHLSDALISSPIIQGEDGTGGAGLGGSGFEFGVDPNEDPELALALRVSMEEQRQRQEDDARRAKEASSVEGTVKADTIKEEPTEEALLERALAMSMEQGGEQDSNINRAPVDFANMTEDEQIAFAMQMSMQDVQESSSSSAPTKEEPMEVEGDEDYSEVMNDPAFLQSVLENLPGVDPQSEAIRQAVGSLKDKKKEDKPEDKQKK